MGELLIDEITYEAFKRKIISLGEKAQHAFVHEIISEALAWAYHFGDISEQDIVLARNIKMKEHLKLKIESNEEPAKTVDYLDLIKFIEKGIDELPTRYSVKNKQYNIFCDEIVALLLEEPDKTI
jgi:hypothetical protein